MRAISLIVLLFSSFCLQAKQKGEDFTLWVRYTIKVDSTCSRILYKTTLPQSIVGQQHIESIKFNVEPDSIYTCDEGKFALYDLRHPHSGELLIQIKGTRYPHDYKTRRKQQSPEQEDVSEWLNAEPYIDCDSVEIKEKAQALKRSTQEGTVKAIFAHVQNDYTNVPNDNNIGALGMLRQKRGDCTEFTDLFVALCRAAGIPARHVYGVNAPVDNKGGTHSWAEVYMDPCGWTTFDPTPGNAATFSTLTKPYIQFSRVRNSKELGSKWLFSYYRWWGQNAPQIRTDCIIL